MRQREDHMVVADGQEFLLPRRPATGRGRASDTSDSADCDTSCTRSRDVTARTAIEMAAQRGRAAAREGAEHAPVLSR